MATVENPAAALPPAITNPLKTSSKLKLSFFSILLFSLSYFLGSTLHSPSSSPPRQQNQLLLCPPIFPPPPPPPPPPESLDFQPHHFLTSSLISNSTSSSINSLPIPLCSANFTDFVPCHDPSREKLFFSPLGTTQLAFFHRERHCPASEGEKPRCLVPRPRGYKSPFPWPKSKGFAWFRNVPSKKLTVTKKSQNWVRLEGELLVFPGGGTSFPKGVKGYVEEIRRLLPELKNGAIRTALDIGCGVASFAAFLMDYNVLTMSVAPRDIHEAQVQFALERGLPAMLGILSVHRLPFPSRSFDMAHCSRCLVPWTNNDGLYLLEIDRVLRPGGYWVLSGPPINWKLNYKGWERPAMDLEQEQKALEDLARRLCWKKVAERGNIAVWRKPTNHAHCMIKSRAWKSPHMCTGSDLDAGWYRKMEACITPLPPVSDVHHVSGGTLQNWPKRLNVAPPRLKSEGISVKEFNEDNLVWRKRVAHYGVILKPFTQGKYRNIMDMNAGIGGFAAALIKLPVWVMNVVPPDTNSNLSIVYQRGLIGTYMNWCEAFSTYPRTYDLIHANGVFSIYMNKCDMVDIVLEMYRILRPEGAVIVRDHVDVIAKLKAITDRIRSWAGTMYHSENGPFHSQKVLLIHGSLS
ncbi:unnamed protein product [Linum trigynum]|uniref:Methyltransferase n=1 Tax=Linum trigynum TaxID=586398 RepID=A0AAV2D3W9_9ROSI